MTKDDEALALAASKGDSMAFETLLRRHYDRMFTLSWRLMGNYHEAQDLTQDLCLALPRKLAGWRGEAKFTTWLYRIVLNASHDRRRSAEARSRNHSQWGDWELARQASNAEAAEARDWMRLALATLAPDLRETAALILDAEMKQAQVAEILDIPAGTVAWRMSEVKRHLRLHAAQETEGHHGG